MLKVSFFSYKGGAGRTSVLYNTVSYMAKKLHATVENPIVVVDLDIDSKGLSFLLKTDMDENRFTNSIQLMKQMGPLFDEADKTAKEYYSSMIPVGRLFGLPYELDRSILFITANSKDSLNGSNNFDAANINLRGFVRKLERIGCRALVMDNPAGGQLSSDIALRVSDKIVTVMRITKQFREGTREFLAQEKNYSAKDYIIVPNAVPSAKGTDYSIEKIMNNIAVTMKQAGEFTGENTVNTDLVKKCGIGEVVRFKFEETNLMFRSEIEGATLADDELQAAEKFFYLSEVICNDADPE